MEITKCNLVCWAWEKINVLCGKEALLNYGSAIFNKNKDKSIPYCLKIEMVLPEDLWSLKTLTSNDYKLFLFLLAGTEERIVTQFGLQYFFVFGKVTWSRMKPHLESIL